MNGLSSCVMSENGPPTFGRPTCLSWSSFSVWDVSGLEGEERRVLTTLFGEFFLFAAEIPEEADACEEEYPSSLWCEHLESKSANDGAWI